MRFLVISARYPPDRGGVADYASHLVRSLSELGHEVRVLTSARNGDASSPGATAAQDASVRRAVTAWNWSGMRVACAAATSFRPDAVIFQYVPQMYGRGGVAPGATAIPLLLRCASRVPVLCTLHEIAIPWSRHPVRAVQTLIHRMQLSLLALGCRCLVVTNARYARLARVWSLVHPEVRLIPPGPSILPPDSSWGYDAVAREREPQRSPLLGDFSPFTIGKRPHDLVAVLQHLPHARLLLIGTIQEDMASRNAFTASVAQAGLSERLTWTGFVASAELSQHLQTVDVYLHTQSAGASARSTTLVTALAHGLAVVAYHGVETPDWFVDGENMLLVTQGDAEAFVSAVHRLLTTEALANRLRRGARQLYQRHFTWTSVAQRYVDAAA